MGATDGAPGGYLVCSLRAPSQGEDELVARACAQGALGAWVRETEPPFVVLEVYFPASSGARVPAGFLEDALSLGASPLEGAGVSVLEERDWLEPYRRTAQPLRVGPLLLDPREPADAGTGSQGGACRVLRLPARRAFGTGSHASTRLVLEELVELGTGLRGAVLDIGCGTGVLSFAALALGAASAVAFDVDTHAIGQAGANRRLNELEPLLFAGSVAALADRRRFDLVLVNVIPEQLQDREEQIAGLLRAGGILVASGILTEAAEAAAAPWLAAGLSELRRRRAEEWTALVLERPRARQTGEAAAAEDVATRGGGSSQTRFRESSCVT